MVLAVNEKNFSDEVLASPTPVLVSFWAPWCGLCRLMNPLLTKLQSEWGDNLKLVSINADENFKLANTYRLTSLPTVLLMSNGIVLYRFEDFHSREDFRHASQSFQSVLESLKSDYSYTI